MAILNLSKPEITRYNENYSLFNDKTSVLIAVKTTTRSELEGPDFDALERVNGYHKSCGRVGSKSGVGGTTAPVTALRLQDEDETEFM